MILLTKLNNAPIAVNCDLIEFVEETPDTVITLTNNDKLVVRDRITEIVEKIVRYRRAILGLIEQEERRQLRAVEPDYPG